MAKEPQPAPAAEPVGAPAPQPDQAPAAEPATTLNLDDPDDRRLHEAMEEVVGADPAPAPTSAPGTPDPAAPAVGQEGQQPQTAPAKTDGEFTVDDFQVVGAPQSDPAPAPGQPAQAPANVPPGFVPVQALQSERAKRQEAEKRAAFLEGQNAVLKDTPVGAPKGTPQPAPQPAERTAAVIRAEQVALAKKADAGELSLEEYEAQRGTLDDELFEVRTKHLQTPQAPVGSDLYLDEMTDQMIQQNPWVDKMTAQEIADLQPFAHRAIAAKGIDLASLPPARQDLLIRKATIGVAKSFNFDKRLGGAAPAPSSAPAPGAQPAPAAPGKQPVLARLDPAQVTRKLVLAAHQPPRPNGQAAPGNSMTSERVLSAATTAFESMTDDEFRQTLASLEDEHARGGSAV